MKHLRQVAISSAFGIPHEHEGGPLVVNKTMYVMTPFPNYLIAYDLNNLGGPTTWVYEPHPSNRAVGFACCDVVNRGGSDADGKIVYNLLDDETVAVDATTGRQVWRTITPWEATRRSAQTKWLR